MTHLAHPPKPALTIGVEFSGRGNKTVLKIKLNIFTNSIDVHSGSGMPNFQQDWWEKYGVDKACGHEEKKIKIYF